MIKLKDTQGKEYFVPESREFGEKIEQTQDELSKQLTEEVNKKIADIEVDTDLLKQEIMLDLKEEGINTNQIFEVSSLDEIVPDIELTAGDIAIVKKPLYIDTENDENNKYSYTSYIYKKITEDSFAWAAMDGNYNADNVYFNNNIKITKPFGKFEPDANDGYVELPAAGKSIAALFKEAFATASLPAVTWPSISLTASGNKTAEVGTAIDTTTIKVTPTANFGSYQYDDTTGVKFIIPAKENAASGIDDITVSKPGFIFIGNVTKHPASYEGKTINEAAIQTKEENSLIADSETMTKTLEGLNSIMAFHMNTEFSKAKYEDDEYEITWNFKAVHTDGDIPQDCLNNPVEEARITSKVVAANTVKTTFTGYRKCFWTSISKDNAIENIKDKTFTSSEVRSFTENNKSFAKNFIVDAGTKQVIFAAPADKYVNGITLTNITNPSAPVPLGISFTKQCEVEGANGYTAKTYNLWIVDLGNPFTVQTTIKVEEK